MVKEKALLCYMIHQLQLKPFDAHLKDRHNCLLQNELDMHLPALKIQRKLCYWRKYSIWGNIQRILSSWKF